MTVFVIVASASRNFSNREQILIIHVKASKFPTYSKNSHYALATV